MYRSVVLGFCTSFVVMGYFASMRSAPVPKRPRAVVVLHAAVTRTSEQGVMTMSGVLHSMSGNDMGWG